MNNKTKQKTNRIETNSINNYMSWTKRNNIKSEKIGDYNTYRLIDRIRSKPNQSEREETIYQSITKKKPISKS